MRGCFFGQFSGPFFAYGARRRRENAPLPEPQAKNWHWARKTSSQTYFPELRATNVLLEQVFCMLFKEMGRYWVINLSSGQIWKNNFYLDFLMLKYNTNIFNIKNNIF